MDDYLDNKEFESAITLLGQAIYTEHRIYRLLKIKLAEVYHVYGKTWAGVEVLLDLLETSTDTNEENNILELKNRYLSEQETFLKSNKLWTELVGFYQKLSYNNNLDFETKIKLAETYLKIGNTDESERIINVILQNNPANTKAIAIKEYILNEQTVPEVITEGKIPIEFVGDSIYIQVMFENKYEVKMLLDTGASMIHISQKLQQLIGIKLNEEVSVRNFITASGRIALPIYKIKSLAVGKFEVKNIEVASMATTLQNNAQGILGMSYLKNYIFSIDTDNSVLELKTK